MQEGGGAYIAGGGSADFTGCNLHNNEAYYVRARILNPLEPSSSAAPLERFTSDCIRLHAGRRGDRLWICELHRLRAL